jgi:chromosome segregation ATPase
MSTAGKVLIILFVVVTLLWMVLASGVAQLNTNYNTKLHELAQQLEKLQVDLKQTRDDIVAQRNATSKLQEDSDRYSTLLEESAVDIEKARSQINETLSHLRYDVATVEETIKGAQVALEHRNTEFQDETKALAKLRSETDDLIGETNQLRDRLAALRKDYQNTYHANLELLAKAVRSESARRGGTN